VANVSRRFVLEMGFGCLAGWGTNKLAFIDTFGALPSYERFDANVGNSSWQPKK
jgi:hypothetical protein